MTDSFDSTGAIIRLDSQGIEHKGGREDGDNEDRGEERRRGDCQGRRRAHPAFVVPLVALPSSVLAEPLPQEDQPSHAGGVPDGHVAVLASDNYLRIYNVDEDRTTPEQSISLSASNRDGLQS